MEDEEGQPRYVAHVPVPSQKEVYPEAHSVGKRTKLLADESDQRGPDILNLAGPLLIGPLIQVLHESKHCAP